MDFDSDYTDEDSINAAEFRFFLNLLPQLHHFALHHADPVLLLVLFQHFTQNKAPRLRRLDLTPNDGELVDAAHWHAALRHCPSLAIMHVDSGCLPANFLASSLAPSSTTLIEFHLSDHAFSEIEPPPLHSLFPALIRLSLTDQAYGPDFARILRNAPTTLKSLTLKRTTSNYDDQVYNDYLLDSILPRFTQLEHVELCEYAFSSDALLPFLRSLSSLSSLTFGPAAPVSNLLLLSLVEAPTQLRSLRTLTLDYVENTRGPTFERKGYCLSREANRTDGHTYPGWVEPHWNWASDGDGLACVLSAAGDSGIEVVGTAVGAESWSEDFGQERYECTMQWCYEEWAKRGGKFKEAIDEYGNDLVREWLYYVDDHSKTIQRELFGSEE